MAWPPLCYVRDLSNSVASGKGTPYSRNLCGSTEQGVLLQRQTHKRSDRSRFITISTTKIPSIKPGRANRNSAATMGHPSMSAGCSNWSGQITFQNRDYYLLDWVEAQTGYHILRRSHPVRLKYVSPSMFSGRPRSKSVLWIGCR